MTRKARPASTLFQAVKPFSVVTWSLMLLVLAAVIGVFSIFNSLNFQGSHIKKWDLVSIIFEVENTLKIYIEIRNILDDGTTDRER